MCLDRSKDCYDLTRLDLGCDHLDCLQIIEGNDISLVGGIGKLTESLTKIGDFSPKNNWPNISTTITSYCIIPLSPNRLWLTGGSFANRTLRKEPYIEGEISHGLGVIIRALLNHDFIAALQSLLLQYKAL